MKQGVRNLGIYIHIPFCVQKCNYCDFCSFARSAESQKEKYVEALCREIESYAYRARDRVVDTVYFGGGTPTLLSVYSFERIFESLRRSFNIDSAAEITCEANPATADYEYFFSLRSLGVNRLSIGLQSANDTELLSLGRIHTAKDFEATVNDAKRAGFENISADIMYGIPDQTLESFERTLRFVLGAGLRHISAYDLKIEDGTPFGRMRRTLVLPDEDTEADMYLLCTELLAKGGFEKYEISNFAHKGYESAHNIKYWHLCEYLGFGVAAHSYFEGERFANSRDFEAYICGNDITCERRKIAGRERMGEYVMLHMRMRDGVDHVDFEESFGESFEKLYGASLKTYIDRGFVITKDSKTYFSDKGFLVSNYILSDILEFSE